MRERGKKENREAILATRAFMLFAAIPLPLKGVFFS
jgi:hypothetical protein